MMTPKEFDAFLYVLAEMPLNVLLDSMRSVVEQLCDQHKQGLPIDTAHLHAMLAVVDRALEKEQPTQGLHASAPQEAPKQPTLKVDYGAPTIKVKPAKPSKATPHKPAAPDVLPQPEPAPQPVPAATATPTSAPAPLPPAQGPLGAEPQPDNRPSLASMLSRNDRLILRRFLPAQANMAPDDLLRLLDQQASLPQALALLQQHFPDQSDNEAIQLLSACLARRFS